MDQVNTNISYPLFEVTKTLVKRIWATSTKAQDIIRIIIKTRMTVLVGKSCAGGLGFLNHKSMRVTKTRAIITPWIGPNLKELEI